MKELLISGASQILTSELISIHKNKPNKNLLIGVSGPVASGKSRFSQSFLDLIKKAVNLSIIYVPFDYWININTLESSNYAGRFFLDDFLAALNSIVHKEQWLCPRYDLVKQGHSPENIQSLMLETTEVVWQQRRFKKVSRSHNLPDIAGGSGVYLEPESNRFFTLFLPGRDAIYFVDGTMIFSDLETYSLYDLKIFITSSWPNRIARMIRRHNRKEVFGQTSSGEREYVGFLIQEAKDCADSEINAQMHDDAILINSSAETISNVLDLCYLQQRLQNDKSLANLYFLTEEAVALAIEETIEQFTAITDIDQIVELREELRHLIESKHLLSITNLTEIFSNLSQILNK